MSTTIARWGAGTPAVAVHEFSLGNLAEPDDALLLAVHAKVISLLSGDSTVHCGHRVGGRVRSCEFVLTPGPWRELTAHDGSAAFETMVDNGDWSEPPPDGVVLVVGCRDGRLRLWCRAEVVDEEYATRIAGYHRTALRLASVEPEAPHARAFLLSEEELRFQTGELAGGAGQLPDRRFHELFEERARAHPDAVAAVRAERQLSYGELDNRANRIAEALLEKEVGAEQVVAVGTERHLDWLAAIIAIGKVGAIYLPIDPRLPARRIATMVDRAGCRLALADGPVDGFDGIDEILLTTLDDHPAGNPGVAVGARQGAYIYFTSGSTGEPKGALCEHAGMLNHLLAKIEVLGIVAGTRVAQNAPQCFDISLWQLLAPLLVGGTTVLIPQDVVLDIDRFVTELAEQRVEVLQVVPSYLDLLETALGGDRRLPALRMVSVTGEALKADLARRWFARCPKVRLVNAYGATEASDDTTHEVLAEGPRGPRVSLGRPIAGARVLVVDENLLPVPLGAPGEIVFSGVCVGRGYVNDEERTNLAFVPDPLRPGERLYRSGDFGRWTPDGKLGFLGRRDNQVKIRGFRVEIGEIEESLLDVPGVREAAVLVSPGTGLIGCYAAPPALPVDTVLDSLSARLPDYMVPEHLYWLDCLPLTDNGKVDRAALTTIIAETRPAAAAPPRTPTERTVAAAWAEVLGLPVEQVDREHDFFEQGGTSLSALRLVFALDRRVTLVDITRRPSLASLAAVLDGHLGHDSRPLFQLGDADEPAVAMLVCFPYAGGTAMAYRPLAEALRGRGIAVYGVDAGGPDEVADDLARLPQLPVLLWGHSSGAARAVETARLLRSRGVDVCRVFAAAQSVGDEAGRRDSLERTARLTDAELAAELLVVGHNAELDEQHVAVVAAAYRRDSDAADRYFLRLLTDPPAPLDVPLTVVSAADDAGTADDGTWRGVADRVEVHELESGGHYFVTTRQHEVARIVLDAL